MGSREREPRGFLALVPARGGSEGLPNKNLRAVQGISLVARAVLIARRLKGIAWVVVSTDDDAIAQEGRRAGAMVPFIRPRALAASTAPMVKVVDHAYQWFRSTISDADEVLEGIVLLVPTSPMRRAAHVREAINLYRLARKRRPGVAAVHTVSPVPAFFRPQNHWRKIVDVDSSRGLLCGRFQRRETDDEPVFYRNGAAVVLDPLHLEGLNLKSGSVIPHVIEEPLVSIDNLYDLRCVEHCDRTLEPDLAEVGWEINAVSGSCGDLPSDGWDRSS